MSRLAILIAAPELRGHDPLPGTLADVERLANWMRSDEGGAWQKTEIRTFQNPCYSDLAAHLAEASRCSYAFSSFSGHGFVRKGDFGHQTMLCLRDGEDIPANALNPRNKRCTVLTDCCRGLHVDLPTAEPIAEFALKYARETRRDRLRAEFDRAVMKCEEGAIYIYSCDKNQASAEDPDEGGLFTYSLVTSAKAWADRSHDAVLRLNTAFDAARAKTTAREPQQHPRMSTRRNLYFPFAVT
jgi:hypothetical protein